MERRTNETTPQCVPAQQRQSVEAAWSVGQHFVATISEMRKHKPFLYLLHNATLRFL